METSLLSAVVFPLLWIAGTFSLLCHLHCKGTDSVYFFKCLSKVVSCQTPADRHQPSRERSANEGHLSLCKGKRWDVLTLMTHFSTDENTKVVFNSAGKTFPVLGPASCIPRTHLLYLTEYKLYRLLLDGNV